MSLACTSWMGEAADGEGERHGAFGNAMVEWVPAAPRFLLRRSIAKRERHRTHGPDWPRPSAPSHSLPFHSAIHSKPPRFGDQITCIHLLHGLIGKEH